MTYNFSEDVCRLNPHLAEKVGKAPSASKYHNAQAEAENLTFQSGREAAGVQILILLEKQHKGVYGLRLQVSFPLPGGISYRADAVYLTVKDGILSPVVVDFKGFATPEYKLKKKLFKATYGLDIEEV